MVPLLEVRLTDGSLVVATLLPKVEHTEVPVTDPVTSATTKLTTPTTETTPPTTPGT